MLISLLIATQGLLPSPTPQSIGVQGLLAAGVVPPAPIVSARDLPGGFSRERQKAVIEIKRGVSARLTTSEVDVSTSANATARGNVLFSKIHNLDVSTCEMIFLQGNVQNISANRVKQSISSSFEIVGCREDDEAEIFLLAQAALEEMFLQDIIDQYDD
jgi:hypothetical protein